MYCPNCGFNAKKYQFCPKCGMDVTRTVSPKKQWLAFALCAFLGLFGVHRFYVGKIFTGILYFLSGGGFVVGWLVDIYRIATGTFKDKEKLPLRKESAPPVCLPPPSPARQPPPAYLPPPPQTRNPPVYIPNVADSVKQMIAPVMDMAEQIKRALVPGAAAEPIPWDNTPPQPAPPPPPEEPAVKPDINTPIGRCAQAVLDYLRGNDSTPFFREKLGLIAARLTLFAKRSGAAREMIVERFGSAGLTYSKFTAPVIALEQHSIGMVDHLMSTMRLFDEADCKRRIQELLEADRYAEMQEYMALEGNYKDSAEQALSALDEALLKLDKLIFEMSKLDEAGLDQAARVLEGIDELIRDTPLYG